MFLNADHLIDHFTVYPIIRKLCHGLEYPSIFIRTNLVEIQIIKVFIPQLIQGPIYTKSTIFNIFSTNNMVNILIKGFKSKLLQKMRYPSER